MTNREWDLDDAMNVVSIASDEPADRVKVPELQGAAERLLTEVGRLQRELSRAEARARANTAGSGDVVGHPLIEGRSDGGPRHYLNERPVHAGQPLHLLTHIGWLPGRYEWGYQAGTPGKFYFRLPGGGDAVSIPLYGSARLAWDDEF